MAITLNANHIAPQDGGYEPQRKNLFNVEFYGIPGVEQLSLSIANATLPGITNEQISIKFRNEERFVAGAATVGDLRISFNDYVDQQTHAAILTWRKLVYDEITGTIGKAALYKKTGKLFMYGPDGEVSKAWPFIGVWPISDPEIALDSGDSGVVQLEVTFKVDKILRPTALILGT